MAQAPRCARTGLRPWDPIACLFPSEGRLIWLSFACTLCLFLGPAFVRSLAPVPPEHRPAGDFYFIPDYFQDYASARAFRLGLPIYSRLDRAVDEHFGVGEKRKARELLIRVNAHPPTSVLLCVPFSYLSFRNSFIAWNLFSLALLPASLGIIGRGLGISDFVRSLAPQVALGLLCFPLWEHLRQGQFSLLLLFLITSTWALSRSGREVEAGVLLGLATCIKLIPGLLFLFFLVRGRWRAVAAGLGSVMALSGLTAALVGLGAYRSYIDEVLPEIDWFRALWENAALSGFWSKLFDPAPWKERLESLTVPLLYSPRLARYGTLGASVAVVLILGRTMPRGRSASDHDCAFGLCVIAMLLVAPVVWNHYFLILLLPLTIVWLGLPPTLWRRAAFLAICATLWLDPLRMWTRSHEPGAPLIATPVHALSILSLQFYALVGLFALGLDEARRATAIVSGSPHACPRPQ